MKTEAKQPIVEPVVRAHVEQAAFLWMQRQELLAADPADPLALGRVTDRLTANLDGVSIAGVAAWPLILGQVEENTGPGELFVAGVMAILQRDEVRISHVLRLSKERPDAEAGLRGALAWLAPKQTGYLVRIWIESTDPFLCRIATAAIADHRVDPKDRLDGLMRHADPGVRAEAYRLAGVTLRKDALGALRQALETEADTVARAQAAMACAALGERSATPVLRSAAVAGGSEGLAALRLAIGSASMAETRDWLGRLFTQDATAPLAVRGAGMLGDTSILAWLVRQMHDPALAVAAGQSLLELFPEAGTLDELFSADPRDFEATFAARFGDDLPLLPVAARVEAWAAARRAAS